MKKKTTSWIKALEKFIFDINNYKLCMIKTLTVIYFPVFAEVTINQTYKFQ